MGEHVGILSTDNGPGIVNGLNIMAAVVNSPLAKPVLKAVMIEAHTRTGTSYDDLFADLNTALGHIADINKMVQDCGVQPIQKGDSISG